MPFVNRRRFCASFLSGMALSAVPRAARPSAAANIVASRASVDLTQLGGDPTGRTPSDQAIENAIVAGVRRISVPAGRFRLTKRHVFSSPIAIHGDAGASVLIPDLGPNGSELFVFDTDDVEFQRIWFDASGLAPMSSVNKYLIMAGNGSVRRKNHLYEDVRFIECNASDGLKVYRNLLVTHGIYVNKVDSVEIKRCGCSGLSGAFVFANDTDRLQIHRPDVVDAHWYPIHLDHGVTNFDIGNGRVVMNNPEGVMWGGGIDSMSQMGGAQNANGRIHDMVLQGYFSYGSACRLESNVGVTLQNIVVETWRAGSWIPPDSQGDMSAFSVGTRGAKGKGHNGPSRDIVLSKLTASAPENAAKHRGIYISNEWTEGHQPFEGVVIEDCRIVSTNAKQSFAEAVTIHGQSGGVENVAVRNLEALTVCQYGSVGTGAVGMLANEAPGGVRGVHLSDLRLRDIGHPSGAQIGVAVGAFTDDVRFETKNTIDGYFYGVRALTGAGKNVSGWSSVRFDDIPPGGARFHRDDAGPLGR